MDDRCDALAAEQPSGGSWIWQGADTHCSYCDDQFPGDQVPEHHSRRHKEHGSCCHRHSGSKDRHCATTVRCVAQASVHGPDRSHTPLALSGWTSCIHPEQYAGDILVVWRREHYQRVTLLHRSACYYNYRCIYMAGMPLACAPVLGTHSTHGPHSTPQPQRSAEAHPCPPRLP
eukprot:COSAG02_NODE_3961_length_5981_cov_175.988949_3_plen_174_part_00